MKKFQIKSTTLILILTLYFSTVLNLSFWRYTYRSIDITSFQIFGLSVSIFLFIAIPLFLLFNLICVKTVCKPFVVALLLVCSFTNFMMFNYGIHIDKHMIQNVMETNYREAADLITMSLFLWVLVTGVIPSILLLAADIQYKPFKEEFKTRLINCLVGILAVGACGFGFYKECASYGRNHRKSKNIINIVNFTAGTVSYINIQKAKFVKREFVELDKNPQILDYQKDTGTHKVVVFIVGETARAANFSLHGYERKTNPLLEKQDIAYFKDATACGTSTAVSVPCLFSHLERKNFDVSDAEFTENLVDLAQKAGYHVIWRDNDDGCKGVCRRIKDLKDMQETKHPVYCNGKDCLDQILLDELMDIFPKIKQNTLIVLHAQGSHGPAYYKRYPDKFKKFLPTCDTSDIKDCSLDQIVNAYDNTILYTDYIISQAIDIAKKYPKLESSVIYVSDHGESLGEYNIFLHGMPFGIAPDEQKSVPMLIWMNENMKKWDHIDYNCLKLSAEKNAYSHDNLFHSLLGLMAIKTSAYDKRYDLFDACRTKPLPYIGK